MVPAPTSGPALKARIRATRWQTGLIFSGPSSRRWTCAPRRHGYGWRGRCATVQTMAGRRNGGRKTPAEPGLFSPRTPTAQPLADRMRPRSLDEVVGQEHLLGQDKMLSRTVAQGSLPSIILWGPPGSGKTTIALLLARQSGANFRTITAVAAGVAELREAVEQAQRELEAGGRRTVVFIDEIH